VILAREAALRHTGEVIKPTPTPLLFFFPGATRLRESYGYSELTRETTPDNYSILMSHFTRQHNVEPQDIRAYLGVGIDYEELC